MKTIELVINGIFLAAALAFLVFIIRYPRKVFIELPLGIINFIIYVIKEELFIGFFLGLFGLIIGQDLDNEYKTRKKKYLTFSKTNKYLITTGTDEGMVNIKISEALETTKEKLKINDFKFITTPASQTITIPPTNISFYDFNYLVQLMTDGRVKTVGLVENNRLAYTVYNDPNTENLIGQTHNGEKFFVSLVDNFDKRQFLRINNEIETIEENTVSKIKNELRNMQSTIDTLSP